MNNKLTDHLIIKLALLFSSTFFCLSSFAQEESKGEVPNFKMNGEVSLLTNYVDHGLTQTNKDPSLQAAFGFNFGPQFKMGVWGSNVNFDSTEHFLLKINAELKVLISTKTDFKLGYYNNQYFKTDTRNGNTTYLVITSHGYRIRYETNSNWEGSDERSTYYSFGKIFDLSQDWKWDNEVGYTMIEDIPSMENYFDLRTSFQYKGGNNIIYQITATGTSKAAQFNGQGDIFVLLGASTSF